MLKRIERTAGIVIDTVFGRRWIAFALIAGLVVLRLSVPEFWQNVLWWTYWGIALCLFAYFILLLRREGEVEGHKPVGNPE